MALSIKNATTEQLARDLAAAAGESVTTAVTTALRQRLETFTSAHGSRETRLTELHRISADAATRWPAELLIADHGALLYDEHGLPR